MNINDMKRSDKNMEELKPCPFCGGTEIIIRKIYCLTEPLYTIKCPNCVEQIMLFKKKEQAIKEWNNRVEKIETGYIGEWFKVNDKTPPENIPILTYDEDYFGICIFNKGQFLLLDDIGYYTLIIRPTHWSFLPEAPKDI